MYENKYKNPAITNRTDLEAFLQLMADLNAEIELFAMKHKFKHLESRLK